MSKEVVSETLTTARKGKNHPCPLLEGRRGTQQVRLHDKNERTYDPVLSLFVQPKGTVPLLPSRRGQGWFSGTKVRFP
jgi:hypothetical protein